MADVYVCFICKARANCISDLHVHQTSHSVNQLSLALLTSQGVVKTEDVASELTNNIMNETPDVLELQTELSQCVTALDKILPITTTKEGRRKKNPKPRRNYKRPTKRKPNQQEESTPIMTRNQKLSNAPELSTEANEKKPIQQPQLSSTIDTPLPPKRALRKKALVNYYDLSINPRIEFSGFDNKSSLQNKPSERNSQNEKVKARRYANRSKKCSGSPLLKSMLSGKNIVKKKKSINIIDAANYKYLQPKFKMEQEPNFKIKENITWNRVYQNYIHGFESYREENYVLVPNKINCGLNTQTNIENKYILSQNQQNITQNQQYMYQNQQCVYQNQQHAFQNQQHIFPNQQCISQTNNNSTEVTNYYNRNTVTRNPEVGYYCQEKLDNINFQNKNTMEQGNSICDWRNLETVHFDNNCNEDTNVENLGNISMSLTSDVKDIIVEFLAQEENARTRNPYWEDNMDKYFPSETESSSEIEQFNEDSEKFDPYAMDAPLNLVVTHQSTTRSVEKSQECTYSYPSVSHNAPLPNYNEIARCKSTWSADYINNQPQTSTTINNNFKSDLSTAYKNKFFCTVCGEDFCNESTMAAHFVNCRGKFRANALEMKENEIILDQHMYENFCINKTSTMTMVNFANKKQASCNNYHCLLCKIGFANRTQYCKHMLNHKKVFLQKKQMLCAACGLLFNNNNALKDHESQCEYKFLL